MVQLLKLQMHFVQSRRAYIILLILCIYLQLVKRTNTSAIGAINLITVFPIPPREFDHMWCRKKVYAVQVGECVDTIAADALNMVQILKQMCMLFMSLDTK